MSTRQAESSLVTWTKARPWLGMVIRLVLGAVWIWASWAKLKDPRQFLLAVRAYDATPEWLSKAIAYGLPVLEMCLGVLLIVGIVVRLAASASAFLFVVFLIGIVQAWVRGISAGLRVFRRRRADRHRHELHLGRPARPRAARARGVPRRLAADPLVAG